MKVVKVLNNSLVLALNRNGYEVVLMGKGIGYSKTIGDEVYPAEIEKEFQLRDNEFSKNIMRLAMEIDSVYFDVSKHLIDIAEREYNMELMDYLFLALTDHLMFVVKRYKENTVLPGFYNNNIQLFYRNEYRIGLKAVQLLRDESGLFIGDDEANTVALHFVNAQKNPAADSEMQVIDRLIKDILDIVQYTAGIRYNTEASAYHRFITHLTYFLNRVLSGGEPKESEVLSIYKELQEGYNKENECVSAIGSYLSGQFDIQINEQERCYLIIHVNRILSESMNS